jgi:3-mercaptopyruvate sulfurtransferase SseA
VAKELIDRGMPVAVIEGGLRAWMKANLPVERCRRQNDRPAVFETRPVKQLT